MLSVVFAIRIREFPIHVALKEATDTLNFVRRNNGK